MATKPTLKQRIVDLLKANGPMTKREILSAFGLKTTSYTSYFDPRVNVSDFFYTPEQLEVKRKASLVATGKIRGLRKNARREILYVAC